MSAFVLLAIWNGFMWGAFTHHLISQPKDPVYVYHIGVDYSGNTVSKTCEVKEFDNSY